VQRFEGEAYSDYVARAEAAGQSVIDEATWNTLPAATV
jgi:hypothetical protein